MGRSLPGGGGCGHCFVVVGRCACEGGQEPFCGSAGVICVGVLGSCMHIRRSRPIECAAVVSKLLSLLDSTAGDHADQCNGQLQASRACTGIRHTNKTACVLFTEQAQMPSRELEQRRNRHRQRWTFPSTFPSDSPPGALASNIASALPFWSLQPQPFTLQQYRIPPCIRRLRSNDNSS